MNREEYKQWLKENEFETFNSEHSTFLPPHYLGPLPVYFRSVSQASLVIVEDEENIWISTKAGIEFPDYITKFDAKNVEGKSVR